jgi:NAD(P)H-hydrate epimerase
LAGDALTNFQIATSLDLDIIRFDDSMDSRSIEALLRTVDDLATDWIVDALLGTGATGDPKPPYNRIIEAANSVRCRRMAVDIPTGLDCDTGLPGNPTFRADLTCTFVTRKIGFRNPLAQEFLGEVRVISIGVPIEIVEEIVRAENEQAGI